MEYLIILIFLSYYALMCGLLTGWRRAQYKYNRTTNSLSNPISVIVPVRNEALNIVALLKDLSAQSYKNFEVFIVDDDSEDETALIIRRHIGNDGRFYLIENEGNGKKRAITTGIAMAKGTVIVTTDGDCQVPADWLQVINDYFSSDKTKMVAGPVAFKPEGSFFSKLQSIEFASLIGTSAATMGLGHPSMCNGANLAFRRSAFEEVAGYSENMHIPSGDDEFLMRKIFSLYPEGILFLHDASGIVKTQAASSPKNFLEQRLRWAGKWKFNSSLATQLLALYIMLVQITFITSFILLAKGMFVNIIIPLMMIRAGFEYFFLYRVSRFLDLQWSVPAFAALQILYPFYTVLIGIASCFVSVKWKGRMAKF